MTFSRLKSTIVIMLLLVTAGMSAVRALDYNVCWGHTGKRASAAAVSPVGALAAEDAVEVSEDPSVHLKPLEPLVGDWDIGFPDHATKPFRAVFQWKGNRSCMAYRTFVNQGEYWTVLGTGMIFWDPTIRAIRETTFEEDSTALYQNGTWTPERDRLVGEFVDYEQGGTRRKTHFVIRFVDRDTVEMTGERQFQFKRSGRGEVLPGGRARPDSPFTLRLHEDDAPR